MDPDGDDLREQDRVRLGMQESIHRGRLFIQASG